MVCIHGETEVFSFAKNMCKLSSHPSTIKSKNETWREPKNHVAPRKSVSCIYHCQELLGLERIHQVTNTIRIANTGWRIRICIREYSDSLYSLAHSITGMRE